ncbi:MAG: GNAT family N-acetyltransferase [Lachnospiraceae bacterium]|nr:GNAT family N-acetyltransferase [Lachnospiraceae bacterium]
MIIRNMSAKDKNNFLSMSEIFYNSEAALHSFDRAAQERNFEASLEGTLPVRCLMLEERDKTVLGYGIVCHSWSSELGGPMILAEELYLKPKARRRGLASEYFRWLFKEYEGQAAGFRLEVAPENAWVMEIYKKHGFEPLEYIQMIKVL